MPGAWLQPSCREQRGKRRVIEIQSGVQVRPHISPSFHNAPHTYTQPNVPEPLPWQPRWLSADDGSSQVENQQPVEEEHTHQTWSLPHLHAMPSSCFLLGWLRSMQQSDTTKYLSFPARLQEPALISIMYINADAEWRGTLVSFTRALGFDRCAAFASCSVETEKYHFPQISSAFQNWRWKFCASSVTPVFHYRRY